MELSRDARYDRGLSSSSFKCNILFGNYSGRKKKKTHIEKSLLCSIFCSIGTDVENVLTYFL